jgi:regulation of enolase protein 1 (concanavalin A-like superfamily)
MKISVTGLLIAFVISMAAQSSSAQPFTSDDFNCPDLDAVWNFVNPLSDGSWGLMGSATGNAYLLLSVPAGTAHDAWGTGGVNQAVRIMQAANNVDFKIEVSFNFEPTDGYNDQGIIVEQDSDNWLRADVYDPGSGLKLFVGTTVAGVNSTKLNANISAGTGLFLLVERVGDTWTVSHSADGTSWTLGTTFTQSYVVGEVGVYAANPITALAFTSEVDWFFEQDNPIDPEDPLNTDRCDGTVPSRPSTWGNIKALYSDGR